MSYKITPIAINWRLQRNDEEAEAITADLQDERRTTMEDSDIGNG